MTSIHYPFILLYTEYLTNKSRAFDAIIKLKAFIMLVPFFDWKDMHETYTLRTFFLLIGQGMFVSGFIKIWDFFLDKFLMEKDFN